MRTKLSNEQKAAMYAGFKILERMQKEDGELPAGFYQDLSRTKLEINFADGTVVERDRGTNGDGTIYKKASQNLNGFAVMTLLVKKLIKFNQWKAMKPLIIEAVKEAVKDGTSTMKALIENDPELAAEIEGLKRDLTLPDRKEETPRVCKATKKPANVVVMFPRSSVA